MRGGWGTFRICGVFSLVALSLLVLNLQMLAGVHDVELAKESRSPSFVGFSTERLGPVAAGAASLRREGSSKADAATAIVQAPLLEPRQAATQFGTPWTSIDMAGVRIEGPVPAAASPARVAGKPRKAALPNPSLLNVASLKLPFANAVGDKEEDAQLLAQLRRRELIVTDADSDSASWSLEPEVNDTFSVIINTFKTRDNQVAYLVRHYGACARVDRVVVLWNDVKRAVPPVLSRAVQDLGGRARVVVQRNAHLTNRFRPQPAVRTEVVFSTDEDVVYACPLLEFGFAVAVRAGPAELVGFAPRKLLENKEGYSYHHLGATRWGEYNTVWATKGAFLHRNALEQYTNNTEFAAAREMVNRFTTGEDLLMSATHAYFNGAAMAKAVMVPRDSFRNLVVGGSLGAKTSNDRHKVFVGIRSALALLKKEFLLSEKSTNLWCKPFELPPQCDTKGSHENFRPLYSWDDWGTLPNSATPFVQV